MSDKQESTPADSAAGSPESLPTASSVPEQDPGIASVQKYLLYTLSLPERTLRTTGAVLAGTLRESTSLLVPQAFQSSKTYRVLVRQTLDFLAEDVGGVAKKKDDESAGPPRVENFVARKAVGNFIDMAGLATLHISPFDDSGHCQRRGVWIANLSARTGGGVESARIVIDEQSTIHKADDLLQAVAKAAGVTASAFDTPPLSVEGLQQTISQTQTAVSSIDPTNLIPQAEMNRLWQEMRDIAERDGVSLLAVSSAVTLTSLDKVATLGRGALSTVRVAGNLFDRHVIDHYAKALDDIRDRGLYTMLSETSGPYVDAVWQNFSSDKATLTEDLLTGKTFGAAWRTVRRWFGCEEAAKDENEVTDERAPI